MARSLMSVLAQETTAVIVLFAGKLHVLASLSLAWNETVSRLKRTVIDSFLASDLDLSFVPTQRSRGNMIRRLSRLCTLNENRKNEKFWYELQLRLHWFFQEDRRCVDDLAKICWEKMPMPCAYLSVFGDAGRLLILPEQFHDKGFIHARDMRCPFLGKTMSEVLNVLVLMAASKRHCSPDSVCGCDSVGGCQFDSACMTGHDRRLLNTISESPLPPDGSLQGMTAAEIENRHILNTIRYFEISNVQSSKKAKNTGLAQQLLVHIVWTEGPAELEVFKLLVSGETRDVYQAETKPWVLKLEKPFTTGEVRNNCEHEFRLYLHDEELRKIIPRCHGYAGVRGLILQPIVGLLVDRLPFTMEEVYQRMCRLEATAERTSFMVHVIVCSVQQMMMMAGDQLYRLRHWPVCSIAFNHVVLPEEPFVSKLIDWSGLLKAPLEQPRKRMTGAIVAFTRGLSGLHTWGYSQDSMFSETEKMNIEEWKIYMANCTETVLAWWDKTGETNMDGHIPTDFELSSLNTELCELTQQFPQW